MNKTNKKTAVLTILAVIGLLFATGATSYAIFSASFTGTKEQKLKTGYVLMNCSETNFNLNDTKVLTDSEGIALTNNIATCNLTTTVNGRIKLGYDIALTDVDSETPDDAIGEGNVKIQASKTIDGNTSYLAGSTNTTGVLINSIKTQAGVYDTSITNYKIDSAQITGSEEAEYKIKAWVASDSSETTVTQNVGTCSDTTKTTQAECEAAGGIWGYNQKGHQDGGTFSFKIKVGASQVLN